MLTILQVFIHDTVVSDSLETDMDTQPNNLITEFMPENVRNNDMLIDTNLSKEQNHQVDVSTAPKIVVITSGYTSSDTVCLLIIFKLLIETFF